MKFYKLEINLLGEDRKISREILVPVDITFAYMSTGKKLKAGGLITKEK